MSKNYPVVKKTTAIPNAADISTDTSNFNGILSVADDDVQKALDTLDEAKIKLYETSTTTATMSDAKDVHICNGSSNYVLTLPTHAGGKDIRIINKNTGAVTLTPTSGTIKGGATVILYEWESLILMSDGVDWV